MKTETIERMSIESTKGFGSLLGEENFREGGGGSNDTNKARTYFTLYRLLELCQRGWLNKRTQP